MPDILAQTTSHSAVFVLLKLLDGAALDVQRPGCRAALAPRKSVLGVLVADLWMLLAYGRKCSSVLWPCWPGSALPTPRTASEQL